MNFLGYFSVPFIRYKDQSYLQKTAFTWGLEFQGVGDHHSREYGSRSAGMALEQRVRVHTSRHNHEAERDRQADRQTETENSMSL